MTLPNLSEWALRHRTLVAYLIVVLMLAGVISYLRLGRAEDPDFTFKAMVVRTLWPGATAHEVELQVTERIEKRLQDVPWVDVVRSQTRAGDSLITILLKDYTPKKEVPEAWYQVRKKIGDIRNTLPQGVVGPYFNDEFGDTFISIFALTGDGFDLAALRREADRIARVLRQVPDVKKIELVGVQDEKIYIEISHTKLATLGLNPLAIFDALQKQNAMTPAGFYETPSARVRIRVSGDFASVDSIREIGIQANGRLFRLGDIATVRRGFADPPTPRMRVQGQPAIGIAIAMNKGGDVIQLGERLHQATDRIQKELPLGIDLHVVADQPQIVRQSMDLFMSSLSEAVLIVLAVSFLSLGMRTGAVVALSIPLVLAISFLLMAAFGIDLQRISLGALVIALGLLVDDAIIAVEMMVVKMEQGWDRFRAATFAYTSTAFPMLTGTLITAIGFMPVGLARSGAGEYTFSIFAVVSIALLVSWIVAVVFTPYLGYLLLDAEKLRRKPEQHGDDRYATPFYRRVRALVESCLHHRWLVIAATVLAFVAALAGLALGVQKQFFPAASRPELLVDLWLPNGASLRATETQAAKVEQLLGTAEMAKSIKYYASYLGNGSPRFYLPLDQQLFNDNFAQFVITTHDIGAREDLKRRLQERFADSSGEWSGLRTRVLRLENGPPIGFPVQFRVSGENLGELRRTAEEVAAVMRENPHLREVNFDWNEMSKVVRLDIDQDRARALGISSQELSAFLNSMLSGMTVTQMREGDQLIDVVARAPGDERARLAALAEINIHTAGGRYVPLAQLARIRYELEDGLIARRNRLPTVTVRADIRDGVQAPTVTSEIDPQLDAIRASLPAGFAIEPGGATEESAKGENSIKAVMPMMLICVVTLLMIQLQNTGRTLLVLLTAPLGLIGVACALLAFAVPFGFVANLGVIALSGMIMRNAVILVDQIAQDEKAGKPAWEAVVGSTVRRFRPIMLTAAAAILAMIPLTRSVFWGPMAVAIMGGLIVATLLTLLFLPALYAACYRIRPPD
ncbi:MAG TPA: efflux RND transporter permease subunit [Accumulibacter sp.]|uniref:efflux RND transporter permease subunit n=1 Tax=Accumulibacter sp. TaxID=2053492 RepID=UPI002CE70903|nr:efflux RND transporter permease subunit [Accumulibacter sp.]HMV05764.1 efflux RND transporter permease subunit [Accumulibacter sp.]HMW63939.1 efflux RND transporter permease subunit [Accumulibacter sp.]HMW80739.1 efflux RND transporter permease subunit [Accumulibacter sp.]HNE40740.1 efflux RND transporter permease subunit [Accumulibacter sp.]HNH92402.1 efflux RND transporter permease subunit [Accumulibacter sp.]